MKKIIIGLFAAVLAVSMIGCKGEAESDVSKYEVGDIVLNDGTYLRGVTSVSDEDKEKAIAVIYKVDGSKAYGVGLVHNQSRLPWCSTTAKGFQMNFTDLQCDVDGNPGDLSFTGDTDGSDNFTKIAKALGTDDDTGIEGNYPAFEFAKNYKNLTNSHVSGTSYEDDWYLPTISELFDIWKVKSTVDASSALCDGFQFGNVFYWSSSQSPAYDGQAFALVIDDGDWGCYFMGNGYYVCCIRVF